MDVKEAQRQLKAGYKKPAIGRTAVHLLQCESAYLDLLNEMDVPATHEIQKAFEGKLRKLCGVNYEAVMEAVKDRGIGDQSTTDFTWQEPAHEKGLKKGRRVWHLTGLEQHARRHMVLHNCEYAESFRAYVCGVSPGVVRILIRDEPPTWQELLEDWDKTTEISTSALTGWSIGGKVGE